MNEDRAVGLMPDAPLPRVDGPISEDEVLQWSEELHISSEQDEGILATYGSDLKEKRVLFITADVLTALDSSVELLLDRPFRTEFSELLFGDLRLIDRGFSRAATSDGGHFLSKWHLAGVVPPLWDAARGTEPGFREHRYALLASFPVPVPEAMPGADSGVIRASKHILRTPRLLATGRPRSHIQDYEVAGWAESIRAELHQILTTNTAWRPLNPRLTREQWFYLLERSVELMADPEFRDDYSIILYGKAPGHDYGYGPADEDCRRLLRRKWRVTKIEFPSWDEDLCRFSFLTPVPFPVARWAARGKNSRAAPNVRLEVMHRDELSFHPHYVLMCAECGATQGGLIPLDCLEDSGPTPREQIKAITARYHTRTWRSAQRLRRLTEHFSEEILGFDASSLDPRAADPYGRAPLSGPIADLLDYCMGFHLHSDCAGAHGLELIVGQDKRLPRMLLLFAGLLQRLRCQACNLVGTVRYWPRLILPLDADVTPSAQSERALALAGILHKARERVEGVPLYRRLFVFPEHPPRHRLVDLLRRFELRHEDRRKLKGDRRTSSWLAAIWVAQSLSSWAAFTRALGFGPAKRGRSMSLESERVQLKELHERVGAVAVRADDLTVAVAEAHGILNDPAFGEIAAIILSHHRHERLDDDLAQFRHRRRSGRS